MHKDFPGSPVVGILCFQCRVMDLIPGQGTKIPHSMRCGQKNIKKKKKNKNTQRDIYFMLLVLLSNMMD